MYYPADGTQLFDTNGQRKYLHASESRRLLAAAARANRETRLFCLLLHYTGCRLSEALALTPRRLDLQTQCVVFRTLKRRKQTYRAVPVPTHLMHELVSLAADREPEAPLFAWSRQTGWRRIKGLMQEAGIVGPQATPKGLRHFFGVHAIGEKVPESAVQRWMGHARSRNTQIYTLVTGAEERALAKRMW